MRIAAKYSHLNGYEWLLHHKPGHWKEIKEAIKAVEVSKLPPKISKEKTMKGKELLSPTAINEEFRNQFHKNFGWEKPDKMTFYCCSDPVVTAKLMD